MFYPTSIKNFLTNNWANWFASHGTLFKNIRYDLGKIEIP